MGSIQVLSIARLLWMGYLSHKMDLHNYQEWIAERQQLFERIKENDKKQWKNSESNQTQNLAEDY